ncbi:XdhC family protein [Lysobacter niastensis]|uniref:XdhC family protein n=1 Tax=Lysobacter niastensis TaxID=380629 RepID=A0ABS0BB74_9GAMM|nr:XdhC/CoxI family protein [Lysobacter niastensis]MBF6025132.1 XdhC family protein [Lysobacter niastensis]
MDSLPAVSHTALAPAGGLRGVLEASAASRHDASAVLVVVVDTEGSTYVRPGGVALFTDGGQVGWLSGGCLEPEIARRAMLAAAQRRIEWLDIDTRDDEDLFSGSAVGCRGRLRLALLSLSELPGWHEPIAAWRMSAHGLDLHIASDGSVSCRVDDATWRWTLPAAPQEHADAQAQWRVTWPSPPSVLVFGAGPETPVLVPWLRRLGWITTLVERRERWREAAACADTVVELAPQAAIPATARFDAALVMHHNFELDREALSALASTAIEYIGLLGPARRREDLFRVLSDAEQASLQSRLRSPVGLDLGGQGAEAIALSIVAQLHSHRNKR